MFVMQEKHSDDGPDKAGLQPTPSSETGKRRFATDCVVGPGVTVGAIAGPGLCKSGDRPMSKKKLGPATSAPMGNVPGPVRVRLKRLNCNEAIPYPYDG